MKYVIIIVTAAIVGYYLYKKKISSEADTSSIQETYVCDKCGENWCDCDKEDPNI